MWVGVLQSSYMFTAVEGKYGMHIMFCLFSGMAKM